VIHQSPQEQEIRSIFPLLKSGGPCPHPRKSQDLKKGRKQNKLPRQEEATENKALGIRATIQEAFSSGPSNKKSDPFSHS